nr:paraneoplastic antigen-like protein 8A isoform X1 [Oryctolagus cuniculus]
MDKRVKGVDIWGPPPAAHIRPPASWALGAMAMNLLEDWCRGMEVDIHRSLLVTGIPEDCGQAEIEETLNAVLAPLGPYRVLNKMFLREENAKAALLEVGEGLNLSTLPREFPGRGGPWRVVCRDPTQDAEFLKNLHEFLEAEGRTWEDVVHLLQLNQQPQPQNQGRPSDSWAEALGVLLGAVVQVIFCMDAQTRSRDEARAQELAEAAAAWAGTAGKKVKKEPGFAAEVGSALKVEDAGGAWPELEDQGDPPKPLVRRTGAASRSRRNKQKNPKQEPAPWKQPRGIHGSSQAALEAEARAGEAESMEVSKSGRSPPKPPVKQEESARKQVPGDPAVDSGSPAAACESDQDGSQETPPRKKKKVRLGPGSYVLVGSEDAQKKPATPKKGTIPRREAPVPRGPQPAEPPASTSRAPTARPGGAPHASADTSKL